MSTREWSKTQSVVNVFNGIWPAHGNFLECRVAVRLLQSSDEGILRFPWSLVKVPNFIDINLASSEYRICEPELTGGLWTTSSKLEL